MRRPTTRPKMNSQNDKEYLNSLNTWRADREKGLRREYGWLSLAGLFWLKDGENQFGSAVENPVRLPARFPKSAGIFTMKEGHVNVNPSEGVAIRFNNEHLKSTSQTIQVDTSGQPDYLFIDDLRLGVIERAGRLAIRIWDPQNPVRLNFVGCSWFEPAPELRVTANIETYPEPKHVMVDDIVGIQRPATMQAALAFELDGKTQRLDAELQEDGSYDIIFKDATAGKSTFPGGRYLTSEVSEGDHVVIDFNIAYNPPCAFTDFATCPLPLPQNLLTVEIEAGEKYQQG